MLSIRPLNDRTDRQHSVSSFAQTIRSGFLRDFQHHRHGSEGPSLIKNGGLPARWTLTTCRLLSSVYKGLPRQIMIPLIYYCLPQLLTTGADWAIPTHGLALEHRYEYFTLLRSVSPFWTNLENTIDRAGTEPSPGEGYDRGVETSGTRWRAWVARQGRLLQVDTNLFSRHSSICEYRPSLSKVYQNATNPCPHLPMG